MGETIKAGERVGRMKDELGLESVMVELGEGNGRAVVDWVIWPDDEIEEEDANYIKRMIFQYRAALETGKLEPDEEVFDDFANLIALHVLLYEELVAEVVPDHVEQEDNEKRLAYFKCFFEDDRKLEDMLWAYANGRAENFAKMWMEQKARRWVRIREVITRRILSRPQNRPH